MFVVINLYPDTADFVTKMASSKFPVAVVGIAIRLSGTNSCEDFWKLLIAGESKYPQNLDNVSNDSGLTTVFNDQQKHESKKFLSGKPVSTFDFNVFQIDPKEALSIEPEQRAFLEVAWELFEDAGYASNIKGSNTGIFIASAGSRHSHNYNQRSFSKGKVNDNTCISSYVSRVYDLKGPAVTVSNDSLSLLAVHLACQGLLCGDCEMAVAGGIKFNILSNSKTERASTGGIFKEEICTAVLLKSLHSALASGDYIYGVLEATAVCRSNAPNSKPMANNVILRALKLANISPECVDYLEADLSDPLEATAITSTFKMFGVPNSGSSLSKIPVGCVKSNVGESGILGLVKTLICLLKEKLPQEIASCVKPKACLSQWQSAHVYISTSLLHWKCHSSKTPWYACVNSTDHHNGTNLHTIVVKDYLPQRNQSLVSVTDNREIQLLALAASTEQALVRTAWKLLQYFKLSDEKSYRLLKDVCFTMNTGREHTRFKHRVIVYASSWERMTISLKNFCSSTIGKVDKTLNHFGYAIKASYDDHNCSNDLGVDLGAIAHSFLNQKGVDFTKLYSSDVQKVPLLPTYAFDIISPWPTDKDLPDNNMVSEGVTDASTACIKRLSKAQMQMVATQQLATTSTAYIATIAHTSKGVSSAEMIFKSLISCHHVMTFRIELDSNTQAFTLSSHNDLVYDPAIEILDDLTSAGEYLTKSIPEIEIISTPLVKFRHLQAGPSTVLAVHMHRIIADEVTLNSILLDLQNFMKNVEEKIAIQSDLSYPDFLEDESNYLESSQYYDDDAFWKEMFVTLPPEVCLSILPLTEAVWNDTCTYQVGHQIHRISSNVTKDISDYCALLGVTDFQYTLSCSLLLLQRYLGTNDITVAIPVTTRTDKFLHTDGLFENVILFRTLIDQSMTIREHIEAVANSWNTVQSHARYPLDEVVKKLWADHGKRYSSFCCVLFDYSVSTTTKEVQVLSKHAKCPLTLTVVSDRQRTSYDLYVEWASDILDARIVGRLSEGIGNLFATAMIDTNKTIQEIDLLPESECRLLKSFCDEHSHNKSSTVLQQFENNVSKFPNRFAIVSEEKFLSYKQLNNMADRIALALMQNISKASLSRNPIVIVMEKSEMVVTSILGVWKAGGHFLPVVFSNWITLKEVLNQCPPAAVLTTVDPKKLHSVVDGNYVILNVLSLLDIPLDVKALDTAIQIESLAYIIRTSGSTGRPKLCKIPHSSLATVAHAWKLVYSMDNFSVRLLQWTPLSFDVFIADVVRALMCSPGQLVMCPEKFQLDVSYIISLIRTHKITMVDVTPQFGMQIVHNAISSDLDSVRIFILGSDVLQTHVYSKIKSKLKSDIRVMNCYGMTEAAIDSSFFEGDIVPPTRTGTVPIGKPLPGVNLHILDSKTLQPCPVGTVGELYISGNVLASGDVTIIELKHQKCSALKTGDAACRLPSGDIELLGRLDSMIKLRGFRISTTEIENKISDLFKEIKEVCVAPLASSSGTEFLCAFVIPYSDSDRHVLDCKTLCDILKLHLPYYMLPDLVHIIDKIPITSHGKVNHKLLPSLSELQEVSAITKNDKKSSNDDNPTIATLKTLFSGAMGIPNIGSIDGDLTFMEQGAHSLILVKFLTMIKQKTNYRVEIADVFSYPSINSLADYINGTSTEEDTDDLAPSCDNVDDIAITGVGLRLPGGITSLAELWEALNKGEYLFHELSDERKIDVQKCLPDNRFQNMNRCHGAFLEKVDQFDHLFFHIPPGEAKYMLPEQRIFLQVATEALAEGTNIDKVKGARIGVFVGAPEQTGYAQLNHRNEPISVSGMMPGMIATRVAYQWDLKGPTMLIDTACSSSLMAMKYACDSIRSKECEGALVGGVNLKLILSPSSSGLLGQHDDILFDFNQDPDAMGASVGEGVLSLYLEPLSTAMKREKSVYGIVKGTASNCVGRGNGITAPSATSQERVIKDALSAAKLKASDISFILAHGTGTKLGDQIELSALSSVFSTDQMKHTLPVGSTKSVFGHVDSLSGILGVFKVLVSLLTKQIPATADFNTSCQDIVNSSLYIPRETILWDLKQSARRYTGVSSYGITGTNCHIIIAENQTAHPEQQDLKLVSLKNDQDPDCAYPLLLNGKNLKHIQKQISLYKTYLQFSQFLCIRDTLLPRMCITVAKRLQTITKMQIGHFQFRLVITATNMQQLITAFELISSIESNNDLIKLSKTQNSIQVHCPDYVPSEFLSSGTQLFLQESVISIEKLFYGHHHNIPIIPGVPIAMYDECRHWLDYNNQLSVTQTNEGLVELLRRKLSETREIVRMLPLQPPPDLVKIDEKFCCALIVKFLVGTKLGEYLKNSKEVNFETAFSLSGMIPKYRKFFYVMMKELLRSKLVVSPVGDKGLLDSFQFQCQDVITTNLESICTLAVEKYPQWADRFRFPLYCSEYLADVLQGRMNPLSVLFPDGNLKFMYTFDKIGDPLGDIYCNVYVQVIANYAMNLIRNGKKVRILEVGGGVGQITQQLLNKLTRWCDGIEYWFTDVGKAYVDQAKTTFTNYSHMTKFHTFDVTKDPIMQGVIGSFDIVLTYNVIHAVPSIIDAVSNIKHCLGDEGILFIIECVKNEMWATLTWGILDGWWIFQDYHIRPHEPMMEPEVWERVLTDAGFASVLSFPEVEHERSYVEKFLFICSIKPLDIPPRNLDELRRLEVMNQHDNSVKQATVLESGTVNISSNFIFDELKKIWTELLGVEDIQANDDFKLLGGESLLALQMTNLIRKRIGPHLEVQDISEHPTLQALANLIAYQLKLQ